MTQLRITVVSVMVGAYLVGFGMLAGVVVDRMLFDKQRSKVLGRYERALKDWHSFRIDPGKADASRRCTPGSEPSRAVTTSQPRCGDPRPHRGAA